MDTQRWRVGGSEPCRECLTGRRNQGLVVGAGPPAHCGAAGLHRVERGVS